MINPHTSPWLRPAHITDQRLYWRWAAIHKHLTLKHTYKELDVNILKVNEQFLIAKNSQKMRLISHLDWAHYNPKTLADAMDNQYVDVYYEQQLQDPKSDPNEWQDKPKEMDLKSYYAARAGRAILI